MSHPNSVESETIAGFHFRSTQPTRLQACHPNISWPCYLANGSRASFTYDDADRQTNVWNFTSAGTPITGFDYHYDAAGRRTQVVDHNSEVTTWTYDQSSQLRSETRTGAASYAHTYTYDPAGNRILLNEDSDLTTFTYDAANRLQRSAAFSGTTTYTYDAAGNQRLIETPTGDLTTTTWDYENQTTQVALPSDEIVTSIWNSDHRQVTREDADGVTRFHSDKNNLLLETDDLGAPLARTTQEPNEFGNLISREDLTTSEPVWTG